MKHVLRITITFLLLTLFQGTVCGQHWQWATDAKGTQQGPYQNLENVYPNNNAVDAEGNTYVVGSFHGTVSFGPITLTGTDRGNLFLAKYDTNGKVVWVKRSETTISCSGNAVELDRYGNIYVTGTFQGVATIDGHTLVGYERIGGYNASLFLLKMNAAGEVLWVSTTENTGYVLAQSLAIDRQGNAFVSGIYDKTVAFDHIGFTNTGIGESDTFLAKYDPNGKVLQAKTFDTDINSSSKLSTDAVGNCYLTGSFRSVATIGHIRLEHPNSLFDEMYLAKLDPDLNILWVTQEEGIGGRGSADIVTDADGYSYITGYFFGSATFGSTTLHSVNAAGDIFLAKYGPDGKARWAVGHGGSNSDSGQSIALDAAGNIYVAGTFYKSITVGSTTLNADNTDMLVIKFDPQGQVVWGTSTNSPSVYQHEPRISVDRHGNSYVSGYLLHDITLGPYRLTSPSFATFIAKIGSTPVQPPAITNVGLASAAFCAGASFPVHVTTQGYFPETSSFRVQLSSASGSFASPRLVGQGTSSPIIATLPADLPGGSGYRIRVVASQPAVTSPDNGSNVTVYSLPSAPMAAPVSMCGAGSTQLVATGATAGQTYRWYLSATHPDPIPDQTASEFPTPHLTSNTTFYVSIVNAGGCESARIPVPVVVSAPPLVVAGTAERICSATQPYTLAGFSPAGGSWSGAGVDAAGRFSPAAAGSGTHTLTYTYVSGACTITATKQVTVDAAVPLNTLAESTACRDQAAFLLSDQVPPGGTWAGKGVQPNGLFVPAEAAIGANTLTYTLQTGSCEATVTKTIVVSEVPTVKAAALPGGCGTGSMLRDNVPFTATFVNATTNATGYLWEFGDGSTSTEMAPAHLYKNAGSYAVYLTVTYGNGCSNRSLIAQVEAEQGRPAPNVFTPNGDHLNDTFTLHLTCYPADLKVYNRWGKLVFEQNNYQNNWDGGNQPNGAYFYQLRATNGQTWKGWVEIIR